MGEETMEEVLQEGEGEGCPHLDMGEGMEEDIADFTSYT